MTSATSAAPFGQADRPAVRRRIGAGLAVVAVHALIGYALLSGFAVRVAHTGEETLRLFDMLPAPPPAKPVSPPRARHLRQRRAASPPNLKATAAPVVAPIPVVRLPATPPIVAAPAPGIGADRSAGASTIAGPGTGSGGHGTGTGGGGSGEGGTPLRWRSGRIKDADYPPGALAAGIGGTVHLRFVVGVTGRVTDCAVTRSSGNAELDETTCRLIRQRLRYRPSTDAAGRPIPEVVTGDHVWTIYGRDDPDAPDR